LARQVFLGGSDLMKSLFGMFSQQKWHLELSVYWHSLTLSLLGQPLTQKIKRNVPKNFELNKAFFERLHILARTK